MESLAAFLGVVFLVVGPIIVYKFIKVVIDYEPYSTLINEIANLSEQLSICFNNAIYKLRNLIYKSDDK